MNIDNRIISKDSEKLSIGRGAYGIPFELINLTNPLSCLNPVERCLDLNRCVVDVRARMIEQSFAEHFQNFEPVHFDVLGKVDHAHATTPQFLDDFITRKLDRLRSRFVVSLGARRLSLLSFGLWLDSGLRCDLPLLGFLEAFGEPISRDRDDFGKQFRAIF